MGATRAWAGSPMAALLRGVGMLGRLDLEGIPREIRDGLRELQDVYSRELDLDRSDGDAVHEPSVGKAAPGLEDASRGFEDGMRNTSIERHGRVSDNLSVLQIKENGAEGNEDFADGPRFWKWGPGATSQDAVRFYRRVL
ncbi:hypothetical protein CJF31_00011084 [Rutstroemia sp. NJR-2017a BVV2]|nr:hypothetical protein CJF31_00011084 [Rutstroemia sp. NJR-2017a BVV2]